MVKEEKPGILTRKAIAPHILAQNTRMSYGEKISGNSWEKDTIRFSLRYQGEKLKLDNTINIWHKEISRRKESEY